MVQSNTKRPLTILQQSTNKNVVIRLKNDIEYSGKIDSVDAYMNMIMSDTEEIYASKTIANYGKVIVRGNNILFIELKSDF